MIRHLRHSERFVEENFEILGEGLRKICSKLTRCAPMIFRIQDVFGYYRRAGRKDCHGDRGNQKNKDKTRVERITAVQSHHLNWDSSAVA